MLNNLSVETSLRLLFISDCKEIYNFFLDSEELADFLNTDRESLKILWETHREVKRDLVKSQYWTQLENGYTVTYAGIIRLSEIIGFTDRAYLLRSIVSDPSGNAYYNRDTHSDLIASLPLVKLQFQSRYKVRGKQVYRDLDLRVFYEIVLTLHRRLSSEFLTVEYIRNHSLYIKHTRDIRRSLRIFEEHSIGILERSVTTGKITGWKPGKLFA